MADITYARVFINYVRSFFAWGCECRKKPSVNMREDTHSYEEWIQECKSIDEMPISNRAKQDLKVTWKVLVFDKNDSMWDIFQSEKKRLLESDGNK